MKEELKIIIAAEISKFKKGMDDAKKETKSFKDQVKEAGQHVDESMKKAGETVSKAAKAMAVGIAGATAAMVAFVASTKEYRQSQNQLQTAFEAAGAGAEEAKQTYKDLYRVLGDTGQATEAALHLAKLTTNEKDLAEWTNACQGIYATFGASLPIESLTEAANETAKVGTVTGALADALNWAGISEDAFNEQLAACNTEAEREALIRTTLNDLYSDAAAKYEENNASILAQNEAQMSLDESMAQLAATLEPLVAQLTAFAADVLAKIAPYLQEIFKWINEHKVVLGIIAGVIAGVAAAIGIYNAVAAIKAAMDAAQVTTIWGLVAAHAAQAVAATAALAPYLLIVAAIAAVIAIIVLCIKHGDDIVAAVKKAFEKIKEAVQKGVDAVVNFFKKAIDWIKENWQGLLLFLVNPIAGAFKLIYDNCDGFREFIDKWVKKIGDFFKGLWDGFKNGAKAALEGVKAVFAKVGDFFGDTFRKAWEKVKAVFSTGGKIFDGIKDGIVKAFKSIVNAIIKGINKVVSVPFNAINNVLERLRNISIANVQPFSWVHTFSVPQIPLLARGGVVDGATLAMIGEQGKEAVVPLENNLGWLDKLATMLADRMGGGRPIVLKVGEKTLAETTFNAWNNYVDQTGSCPVKVW